MLGIDLFREALILGEASELADKEYKIKGCPEDSSTFFIKNKSIVRDDFTGLFSLDLQWVMRVFFVSELEEVSNHIVGVDILSEKLNKVKFRTKDSISGKVGVICRTRAEISLMCSVINLYAFKPTISATQVYRYLQETKGKAVIIYESSLAPIESREDKDVTVYTFSELLEV